MKKKRKMKIIKKNNNNKVNLFMINRLIIIGYLRVEEQEV